MPAIPSTYHLTRKRLNLDDRIVQGSDYSLTLAFSTDYGSDWTGFACRAQLRVGLKDDYPGSSNVVATFTATIVDPPNRVVNFVLSNATTSALTETEGKWDAEIYNGTVVYRIVQGRWALNQETTDE